jgi:transposase
LLKRPEDLTDSQRDQLGAIRRVGGQVWRAYQLKEALRAIFDPDLTPAEAARLLDRFVSWAQRSRLPSFVKLQRTIREHRAGILAALELGINNGRTEGLNRKVRAITSRTFGFHTFQRGRRDDHAVLRPRPTTTPTRRTITSVTDTQCRRPK